MFNQDQIQEFKEAFNMIDHNRSEIDCNLWSYNILKLIFKIKFCLHIMFRDGFIDNEDLHDMLASLGKVRFPVIINMIGINLPAKRGRVREGFH